MSEVRLKNAKYSNEKFSATASIYLTGDGIDSYKITSAYIDKTSWTCSFNKNQTSGAITIKYEGTLSGGEHTLYIKYSLYAGSIQVYANQTNEIDFDVEGPSTYTVYYRTYDITAKTYIDSKVTIDLAEGICVSVPSKSDYDYQGSFYGRSFGSCLDYYDDYYNNGGSYDESGYWTPKLNYIIFFYKQKTYDVHYIAYDITNKTYINNTEQTVYIPSGTLVSTPVIDGYEFQGSIYWGSFERCLQGFNEGGSNPYDADGKWETSYRYIVFFYKKINSNLIYFGDYPIKAIYFGNKQIKQNQFNSIDFNI